MSWTVVSPGVPLKCCSRVMELLQPLTAVLAAAPLAELCVGSGQEETGRELAWAGKSWEW